MGIDHVTDRLCGDVADRREQPAAFARAAAGVDHGDRVIADHEADVRDRALVFGGHQFVHAEVNEDAGRHFAHCAEVDPAGPAPAEDTTAVMLRIATVETRDVALERAATTTRARGPTRVGANSNCCPSPYCDEIAA